jgi:hypothetical protein
MRHSRIYLNAFHMNCVVHQSPGLWVHPADQMLGQPGRAEMISPPPLLSLHPLHALTEYPMPVSDRAKLVRVGIEPP